MTTSYLPAPVHLVDMLPTTLALALMSGVTVTTGDIPAQPCPHCAEIDAVTTVRVYGDPDPAASESVLGIAECCAGCAPGLVERALAEQDDTSRTPIRVEIVDDAARAAA